MNFLSLSQRLIQEAGVSGTLSTTANATGEFLRITSWINSAWNDLQTRHDDWWWLRSSVLVGGGASYVPAAGIAYTPLGTGPGTVGVTEAVLGKWAINSFRCNTTTVTFLDETYLDPIEFDEWRDSYMYGANRSVQTRPVAIAIGPNKQLCVGPPSNGLYTVTGDYFRAPTQMTADTDTPTGLPAQFHMAIVYNAMMMYAGYEAASEVYQRGEAGYKRMMAELEVSYAQKIQFGGALA